MILYACLAPQTGGFRHEHRENCKPRSLLRQDRCRVRFENGCPVVAHKSDIHERLTQRSYQLAAVVNATMEHETLQATTAMQATVCDGLLWLVRDLAEEVRAYAALAEAEVLAMNTRGRK